MRDKYGVDSMGETAENVAVECSVSRADQDAFALLSQQRCAAAVLRGDFADEITPVAIPKKGNVDRDEHPRPETTAEGLAKLKPVVMGVVAAPVASVQFVVVLFQTPPPPLMAPFGVVWAPLKYC